MRILVLACLVSAVSGQSQSPANVYSIHGGNVSIIIDPHSPLVMLNTSSGFRSAAALESVATDDAAQFTVTSSSTSNCGTNAVCIQREVQTVGLGTAKNQSFNATLIDRFEPSPVNGAVRWTLTVKTPQDQQFWHTAITTRVSFPNPASPSWLHWVPRNGGHGEDVLRMLNSNTSVGCELGQGFNGRWTGGDRRGDHAPMLLAVVSDPAMEAGVAMVGSPIDQVIAATIDVNSSEMGFRRLYNRLGRGSSVSFVTDLAAVRGKLDPWRDAMQQYVQTYPALMAPVVPAGADSLLVGMGLYSCAGAADINVSSVVQQSGANLLWDAHFWWPYIGMMLPPAAEWASNTGSSEQTVCSLTPGSSSAFKHGQQVSRDDIRQHYQNMTKIGIRTLAYFNLFEFGEAVQWPLPNKTESEDWQNSSQYISNHFSTALIDDKAEYTWQGAISLSPGDQSFAQFLVAQVEEKVKSFGSDLGGIAIDRTDHVAVYNMARDDGIAWCGAPCSNERFAWAAVAANVSNSLHRDEPDRLMLVNYAGSGRIEMLADADGIFSESGNTLFNTIGLSTVKMPAVAWTYSLPADFDTYFQQLMYVNVQPMAPVFGADHSIPQSDTAQAAYAMYGPLFRVLRGSTWKLESGAVTLDNQQARFNVFETVNSTIVAIVLAPNVSHVNVGLNGVTNTSSCAVLQPAQALRTNSLISASGLIPVQLRRGCALLICARDD